MHILPAFKEHIQSVFGLGKIADIGARVMRGTIDLSDVRNVVSLYYNEFGHYDLIPAVLVVNYEEEVNKQKQLIAKRRTCDPEEKQRFTTAMRTYILDDMKRDLTTPNTIILTKRLQHISEADELSPVNDVREIVLAYYEIAHDALIAEDGSACHEEVIMSWKFPRRLFREFRKHARYQLRMIQCARGF